MAVTLSKVEFLTNILALGYALFWVDTDVVFFASPLPHLADMQADMAVGLERCDVISNFSSGCALSATHYVVFCQVYAKGVSKIELQAICREMHSSGLRRNISACKKLHSIS